MKVFQKGLTVALGLLMVMHPVFGFDQSHTTSLLNLPSAPVIPTGQTPAPLPPAAKVGSSSLSRATPSNSPQFRDADYVPDEVLVVYRDARINLNTNAGQIRATNFAASAALERKQDLKNSNASVLRITDGTSVAEIVSELQKDINVAYVQPNYQYYPLAIATNDTLRDQLWALDNTGQTVNSVTGTVDADIDIPEAWLINEGTSATTSVVVAVIDTGVAYNHPDLLPIMWDGTNCRDERGDVLGGCNFGYDFEDYDSTPLPTFTESGTESHGTHIAGTIAAVNNNNLGITGVAPNARIMAIKSSLTTSSLVDSINFATYNDARIINASWGGNNYDQLLKDAIDSFPGIFVTAAGNDGADNDVTTFYPSSYDSVNLITTAATNQDDGLAWFSNYGSTTVDVGAPGTNIYSTVANSLFYTESFEDVTPPALPAGWVTEGATETNWRTSQFAANNYLLADSVMPYATNTNTSVTSETIDLSSYTNAAYISFLTECDTEYSTSTWNDYMSLELTADGVNFVEFQRWDEAELDAINGDEGDSGSAIAQLKQDIPIGFRTSNFQYRFRWVSNESITSLFGCVIDDITINSVSDGSDALYDYLQGTSFAAPHVAGLAALLLGYNPTLTNQEVIDAIVATGDDLPSLSNRTISGKRINAHNALQSVAPEKAITTFSFTDPTTTGVVNEVAKLVTITVPFGTSLNALTPEIAVSRGATVNPASGIANNFTSTTTYTVTAVDGTTQPYEVVVNVAPPSSLTFITSDTYTVNDASSTIVAVPFNTSRADFLSRITRGEPNQTLDTSGLSDPVVSNDTVMVTAQDGVTTRTYTLTVALNPAKDITSFTFAEGVGSVGSGTVAVTVPYGTDVTNLVPTISISGAMVSPASGVAQDFTNPVEYTVTAADGTTQVYVVSVDFAPNTEANILLFASSDPASIASIDGVSISLVVPFGTNLTDLPINITLSDGATVSPAAGTATFEEGVPSVYSVTAADGVTTRQYSVVVTIALNTAKDITSFTFAEGVGSVGSGTVAVTVPYGTDVTNLVPTISISGAMVSPASGVAQDFTNPVEYTVTAADGTTQVYTVTVSLAPPSSDATISSGIYSIDTVADSGTIANVSFATGRTDFLNNIIQNGPDQITNSVGLSDPVVTDDVLVVTAQDGVTSVTYTVTVNPPSSVSVITSDTYTVNDASSTIVAVPFNTSRADFLSRITRGEPNQTLDTSGLSDPVVSNDTVMVTAQDGVTTRTYTLTVALNPAKAITDFSITGQLGVTAIDETTQSIVVVMPFGTEVSNLVPVFTITGASTLPDSGVGQDFTSPVIYTVTAADGTTQNYEVTVVVLQSSQSVPDSEGAATIDQTASEVLVTNTIYPITITVADSVLEPTLNLNPIVANGTGLLPAITLSSSLANVRIPADTTISSTDLGWNGVFRAPRTTSLELPVATGRNRVVTTAFAVGYADAQLSFDRGVRILLPGQAGRKVGYVRNGITFTEITTTCASDAQSTGDALPTNGDCMRNVGSDLVIWTKHFTTFAAYTDTSVRSSGGGGGGGGGGSRTKTTPVAEEPVSAPTPNLGVKPSITTPVVPASTPQITTSSYTFVRDLTIGSEGSDVIELQNRLTTEGVYSGPVTGYFGPLTMAGVKAYQTKYGLIPDGYVGLMTRTKLNAHTTSVSVFNPVNDRIMTQIAALQARLELLLQLLAIQLKLEQRQ